MTDVFIGIGSNTDPTTHIAQALGQLAARFGRLDVSSTYRNPAVGFAGEDFLNLVVSFETDRTLARVVGDLLEIELSIGKDFSSPKLSPQIIDLDLLLFGDLVLTTERLQIPRPETLDQAYCLKPLAELCPDRAHPTAGATFAELWQTNDAGPMERFEWQAVTGKRDPAAGSELRINDLRLAVHLGVGEAERSKLQDIALSVAMNFEEPPQACADDDIAGTVDYGTICEALTELCTSREFKTIEHVAQICFDRITHLTRGAPCALEVEVHKCRPPIADLAGGTTFVLKSRP